MANSLEKLCKEIIKKAHKIEVDVKGENTIFYFLTPDDSIYKKFSKLPVRDVKEIMKKSGISLSYVDIKNDWITQYSENGAMGDRYSFLPDKQKELIEKALNPKKKKRYN